LFFWLAVGTHISSVAFRFSLDWLSFGLLRRLSYLVRPIALTMRIAMDNFPAILLYHKPLSPDKLLQLKNERLHDDK
jgi:hypothetical protein